MSSSPPPAMAADIACTLRRASPSARASERRRPRRRTLAPDDLHEHLRPARTRLLPPGESGRPATSAPGATRGSSQASACNAPDEAAAPTCESDTPTTVGEATHPDEARDGCEPACQGRSRMGASCAGRNVDLFLVALVGDAGPAKPVGLGPWCLRVRFSRPRGVRLELSRRPEQRGQDHRGQPDHQPNDPAGDVLAGEHVSAPRSRLPCQPWTSPRKESKLATNARSTSAASIG